MILSLHFHQGISRAQRCFLHNLFKVCCSTYAELMANKDKLGSKYRLGSTNLYQQQLLCNIVTKR